MNINSNQGSTPLTIVRDLPAADCEVYTSLEDSVLAGVTIDTNPASCSTVVSRRGGDLEGSTDRGESSL